MNLPTRYSSAPTQRHLTGIKHITRYLHGTTDLKIFSCYDCRDPSFVGYVDQGYLSDSRKSRSQTGYVFLNGNAATFWSSTKQTLVATLAFYEASRECVWLKSLIQHVRSSCQLASTAGISDIIYEDNE